MVLEDQDQLADPATHGWTLTSQRPEHGTPATVDPARGLQQHWQSPDGQHTLFLFWVSATKLTDIRFDNHALPPLLNLLNLVICGRE